MATAFEPTDCFSPAMERITDLDLICTLDCNIEAVPDIILDPDQRDVQFPPITPNQNITLSVVGLCQPSPGSSTTYGSNSATVNTADTSTWTRATENDASLIRTIIKQLTRVSMLEATETDPGYIYAFYRDYNYDSCGRLHSITGETRIEVSQTGPCPPPE